ncbi:hypothetical protein LXL04_000160 [Taraxacum kok-saghyz]
MARNRRLKLYVFKKPRLSNLVFSFLVPKNEYPPGKYGLEAAGIEALSIEQQFGVAVFIPAGCPFQVRNLQSRSFKNSYISENPRTPKPLTFSKNRLRGAKNRSNISPVAKKNFRKNDFFFSKNFAYVQTFFLCICAQFFVLFQNRSKTRNFFKFFYRSLYNTYLKSCTYAKVKKKYRFFGKKFQRIVMIKNVLESSEVGFLKGITVWEI